MKSYHHVLLCTGLLFAAANVQAVPIFGAKASGSDLVPVSAFLNDGGAGSATASVSFSTFAAEATFDPGSTYLPILKARSEGEDATFDDDRTQAQAEAYQAFTSTADQTISIDVILDSIVTNAADGTSGVLSDVFVYGGSDFEVSDGYCSSGQFMFDGIYMCGNRLDRTNLFNGGSSPLLGDSLDFTVSAGESFGIYARLSAGSFMGTANAFDTLTMAFEDDTFIDLIEVPAIGPTPVPEPGTFGLVSVGLLGVVLMRRKRAA